MAVSTFLVREWDIPQSTGTSLRAHCSIGFLALLIRIFLATRSFASQSRSSEMRTAPSTCPCSMYWKTCHTLGVSRRGRGRRRAGVFPAGVFPFPARWGVRLAPGSSNGGRAVPASASASAAVSVCACDTRQPGQALGEQRAAAAGVPARGPVWETASASSQLLHCTYHGGVRAHAARAPRLVYCTACWATKPRCKKGRVRC